MSCWWNPALDVFLALRWQKCRTERASCLQPERQVLLYWWIDVSLIPPLEFSFWFLIPTNWSVFAMIYLFFASSIEIYILIIFIYYNVVANHLKILYIFIAEIMKTDLMVDYWRAGSQCRAIAWGGFWSACLCVFLFFAHCWERLMLSFFWRVSLKMLNLKWN